MNSVKIRSLPLYRRASESILQRLQANEWQEGEAIPSEFELAAQHEVSQGTMRKALDLLVEEGVLVRRQGAGTFVAARQDFIKEARAAQLGDPSVQEKIRLEFVGMTRMHASTQLAEELKVRRASPLWQITRLLRVNASLFAVDLACLPECFFPLLNATRLRHWNANLKQMCLIDFGMHVVERHIRYRAVLPSQEISRVLKLGSDMPLLERIRVIQNRQNQPVIWGVTTFKTDEFAFCPTFPSIL
jgi:GntR family transcriptional regulator